MPNIQDKPLTEKIDRIVAIVMSPPGGGKTFLAGTFPRPNFLDFDQKIMVLRNPAFISQHGMKSVEYGQFLEKSYANPNLAPNAYDDANKYFDLWMQPAKVNTFDTWVIDSGTSLSEVARRKGIYIVGSRKLSGSLASLITHGAPIMEQNDWGMERQLLEKFIRMVINSGKNVLINVHEKEVTNDAGFVTAIKPLFTGQSADIIPSIVPDVWVLDQVMKDNKLTRILTGSPYGKYRIRSELGLDQVIDPTYDKIVDRMKELQRLAISLSQKNNGSTGASQPATVAAK